MQTVQSDLPFAPGLSTTPVRAGGFRLFGRIVRSFSTLVRSSNEEGAWGCAAMAASPQLRKELDSLHVHCPSNF
jgi:hypothetical protein